MTRIINGQRFEDDNQNQGSRVINTEGAAYTERIAGTVINIQGNVISQSPAQKTRKDLSKEGSPAIDV